MNALLISILQYFISPILGLLVILIFVHVIMSWLVSFNVVNLRNSMMRQIYFGIETLLKPIMAPIQRIVPSMGGLDFSPIIALLFLQWLNGFVVQGLIRSLA